MTVAVVLSVAMASVFCTHGLNSCLLFAYLLLFVGVSLELFQMGGSFIFRFVSFFSTHNKVILLLLISSLFCFVFFLFLYRGFPRGSPERYFV